MAKTDSKFRIEIDGLPEISFDRIEPDAADKPGVVVEPLETVTLEAPDLTVDARHNQTLADWYTDALNAEPWREPCGIISFGVEAWELGECKIGTPVAMPDGSHEMTVKHAQRIHGYYFDCPFCGATVVPSDAPCNGPKVADSIQCPACGITSTPSILEGRRKED